MPEAAQIDQLESTVLTPVPVARTFVPKSEDREAIAALLARFSLGLKWEWEYDPMCKGYNVIAWAKLKPESGDIQFAPLKEVP